MDGWINNSIKDFYMDKIVIKPYESVGLIHFGQSINEVISCIGKPDRIDTISDNDTGYYYSWGLIRFSSQTLGVVEVTIFPREEVYVEGINIFKELKQVKQLAKLANLENNAFECLGILFLMDLGIALSGFHRKETDRVVSAFAKGQVDLLRDFFKPYKL